MDPLVISASSAIDLAEMAEAVGPDLTVTRLPIVSKRLTGQDVAISILLGMAGNAGYAAVKLALEKLAAWLARATEPKHPSASSAIQITVSAGGTTVIVQGDENTEAVAVVLEDWARQARGPADR
jgi:hypothetical protein